MRKYQVILQDEYNNLYMVGFYDDLDDSIEELNKYLDIYDVELKKGDLRVYKGVYDDRFDLDLCDIFEDKEDVRGVMIRGFIYEEDIWKLLTRE